MAIVNRSKDASEQKQIFTLQWGAQFSTGATQLVAALPYPCTVLGMEGLCLGISGAPQISLRALRQASGGATSIVLGISNMVLNNGVSLGAGSYSGLAATGSTLLNLQYKDVLVAEMAGANAAATQGVLTIVVKKTQDIVSHLGSSG